MPMPISNAQRKVEFALPRFSGGAIATAMDCNAGSSPPKPKPESTAANRYVTVFGNSPKSKNAANPVKSRVCELLKRYKKAVWVFPYDEDVGVTIT